MNTNFRTPTNKIEKGLLIARSWHLLLPIPDGCKVAVEKCDCAIQYCECAVELELLGNREAWREDDEFADRMHRFLLAVDPTNYAERYIDPNPLLVLSMDRRLDAMRQRVLRGFVCKNPNDMDVTLLKIGEGAARGRNGMAYSKGLEKMNERDSEPLCGRVG